MLVLLGVTVSLYRLSFVQDPFSQSLVQTSLLHSNVISFSTSHNFIARLRFLFVFSVF